MKASSIRRTTCEKDFVLRSIKNGIRLDGRQSYDYRAVTIDYGVDYGCCDVKLGDTRVLAQVSCELVKPSESRPTEGTLFMNVELSPMASPAFESGRLTEYGVEVNRMVERCLKESRPIDVESLCIVANEKVWAIRVDMLALNDSGNIVDCACIAAVAALAHFKRPDVTVSGSDVTIHSFDEKEGIPLNVHHMPICITFGFIGNGDRIIIDPEEKESSILSGDMVMACNTLGEICCAQMSGGCSLEYEQIMQCANIASVKASEITQQIKEVLEEDRIKRAPKKLPRREGLKDPVIPAAPQLITKTIAEPTAQEKIDDMKREAEEMAVEPYDPEEVTPKINKIGSRTAGIGGGGASSWIMSDAAETSDNEMEPSTTEVRVAQPSIQSNVDINANKELKKKRKKKKKKKQITEENENKDSDSEEEQVTMLPSELGYEAKTDLRNPIESPSPDRTDSKNSLDGDRSNDENVDQANLISTTVADTDPAIKNADQIALSKKKKKKKKKAKNIAVADS